MSDGRSALATCKTLLNHILPTWLIKLRRSYVTTKERKRFAGLSTQEVFTQVYNAGGFGGSRDPDEIFSSGSGSHNPIIVDTYIEAVQGFLRSLDKKPNAVDLGCGDFSVGSRIRYLCDNYIACDIVESVIDWNRQRYRDEQVEFRVLDMIEEELPEGDIVFIRQVLQHLSNDQILAVIPKITIKYKYLILTEHLPSSETFSHNIDKPVGPDIRLFLGKEGSGIILTSPPFNLLVTEDICLCEAFEFGGIIRTNVYRLK